MKTGNVLKLAAFVLIFATGCETITVQPELPCPSRPLLEAFTIEEIQSMTDEAKRKAAQNQIILKAHIKKLETRAGCDEGS